MKFSGKVGNGPLSKRLNFGGDPDHGSGIATLVRLGGGMHSPSVSSCTVTVLLHQVVLDVKRRKYNSDWQESSGQARSRPRYAR